MRWQEFIDGYDWKARLIPTVIALRPLFSTVYYFFPGLLDKPLQLAGSSLLFFALVYKASMFFRDLGVRYAKQFWDERNGLPSTRFGRMRDPFLSAEQKIRIQLALRRQFGIRLMSLEEEYEYPAVADRKIMDAFREIKEFLRWFDSFSLVDKHGAEYGFARNLSGARMVFVIEAISGVVICGFKGRLRWTFTSGCGINVVLLALWVPFAWLILRRMLMLSAEAYAGRAWITFLSLAERSYKKPNSSVSPQTDHHCASSE